MAGLGQEQLARPHGAQGLSHQHPRWQLLLPVQAQIFQPGFYPITVAVVWFLLLAFPSLQFLWRRFLGRVPTTHTILSWQQSELPPKASYSFQDLLWPCQSLKCALVSLCLKRHRIEMVRDGERLCSRVKCSSCGTPGSLPSGLWGRRE